MVQTSQATQDPETPRKPRGPRVPKLKARDLEVYQAVELEKRKQTEVAAQFKLSQGAVSKILRKARKWMAEPFPTLCRGVDDPCELTREQRLFLRVRTHRGQLEHQYAQVMEEWRRSCQSQVSVKKVWYKGELREEHVHKTQIGNPRLIAEARKISWELTEFEGISRSGEVDISCQGRLKETLRLTKAELMMLTREQIDELLPQVEAWERKQAGKKAGVAEQVRETVDQNNVNKNPVVPQCKSRNNGIFQAEKVSGESAASANIDGNCAADEPVGMAECARESGIFPMGSAWVPEASALGEYSHRNGGEIQSKYSPGADASGSGERGDADAEESFEGVWSMNGTIHGPAPSRYARGADDCGAQIFLAEAVEEVKSESAVAIEQRIDEPLPQEFSPEGKRLLPSNTVVRRQGKLSIDVRGRVTYLVDGLRRPFQSQWIDPEPSKLPYMEVDEDAW